MDDRRIRIVSNDEFDEPLANWAAERLRDLGLPNRDAWGPCKCAGIWRDDQLTAVVVYHGYQPYFGQIQMSLAADNPKWCNRGVMMTLLDYPFRIGLHRIWVLTKTDNKRVIRLLKWIGFIREGTLREFFGPGIDAISWCLLKDGYAGFLEKVGRDERRRRQGQGAESAEHGEPAQGHVGL